MTDMMKLTPPRFGDGPVHGEELEKAFSVMYRDVFSRLDVRYPSNDFNAGLVADKTGGVTLGSQAYPAGRTSPVPTLTSKIADNGQAADQRFLPQVSSGNKLSVQSMAALTAITDGSTGTIYIAPHTLQYGYGQVSYSGGTISGLLKNTSYRVYASDPDYKGGAVTYLATTNPQTVMADNGNYYVGSVTTVFSASVQSISGATSALPIVCSTGTTLAWVTGDSITFDSMPGDFAVLNGNSYLITVLSANTFSIVVDGHLFAAYAGGGNATRASASSGGGAGAGGGFSGGTLL